MNYETTRGMDDNGEIHDELMHDIDSNDIANQSAQSNVIEPVNHPKPVESPKPQQKPKAARTYKKNTLRTTLANKSDAEVKSLEDTLLSKAVSLETNAHAFVDVNRNTYSSQLSRLKVLILKLYKEIGMNHLEIAKWIKDNAGNELMVPPQHIEKFIKEEIHSEYNKSVRFKGSVLTKPRKKVASKKSAPQPQPKTQQ